MLTILVGSENDKVFLKTGLDFLTQQNVQFKLVVVSCRREPERLPEIIDDIVRGNGQVVIVGAATATGLPGVVAGHLRQTKSVVL